MQAWIDLSERLADWAFARFINRTDVCGTYIKGKALTGHQLNGADVAKHFRGEAWVGAHNLSEKNDCKWIAFDVDRHDDKVTAEENWQKVLSLLDAIKAVNLRPLVEDSNGDGGFHVFVFFTKPIPGAKAFTLARYIRDKARVSCEAYPKQAESDAEHPGSWVRLPGKHHSRDHWSKFYDKGEWKGPEYLLNMIPNSLQEVPPEAFASPKGERLAPSDSATMAGLPDFEDTLSALDAIPNVSETWQKVGCSSWYDLWFRILGALSLYDTPETLPLARTAALRWSMQHPDGQDEDEFEKKWQQLLKGKGKAKVTGRSIIDIAQKHFNWEAPIRLRLPNSPEPAPAPSRWAQTPEELKQKQLDAIEKINKEYAVIKLGSQTRILYDGYDAELHQPKYDFKEVSAFRLDLSNQFIQTGLPDPANPSKPPAQKPLAPFWIAHSRRKEYQGGVFQPGGKVPDGYLNLWRGWGVEPKEGDCSIFLNHLQNVICSGNADHANYLIAWMADAVQNPTERPGICVVLKGRQGAGKNMVMNYFGPIFGPHYKEITNSSQLVGKFNAHQANTLLLFANEAFNVHNKQAEGTLKSLITDSFFMVEAKGVDATQRQNLMRIVMASNNEWIVPASMDDRRFFVLDVADSHIGDRSYFKALVKERENGGIEAFFHYLLHYDLSDMDLRDVPKTAGLVNQKIRSLESVEAFWYGRLQSGLLLPEHETWQLWVRSQAFYERYQRDVEKIYKDGVVIESTFWKTMKHMCPGLFRIQKTEGTARPWGYKFPLLDRCREHFCRFMNSEISWDNAIQDSQTDIIADENVRLW